MPIYEVCSKLRIPVTTHCGGNIIATTKRNIKVNGFKIENDQLVPYTTTIKGFYWERAEQLNNPELWEPVLKKYNDLKLNFGHFGGIKSWKAFSPTSTPARIQKIIDYINNPAYKNVYTDFSFNLHKLLAVNNLQQAIANNPKLKDRLLFGTDFHVILPITDLKLDIINFKNLLNNHWERLSKQNPREFLGI